MLKHAESLITPFLRRLFNKLFDFAIFPDSWTKAIIVPIHKKGNKSNPDNYRGISLLCIVSKVYTCILKILKIGKFGYCRGQNYRNPSRF